MRPHLAALVLSLLSSPALAADLIYVCKVNMGNGASEERYVINPQKKTVNDQSRESLTISSERIAWESETSMLTPGSEPITTLIKTSIELPSGNYKSLIVPSGGKKSVQVKPITGKCEAMK